MSSSERTTSLCLAILGSCRCETCRSE
jgi:hypothetical protein